jgi:hypothetical protein
VCNVNFVDNYFFGILRIIRIAALKVAESGI